MSENKQRRWSDEFADARMMYHFYWSARTCYGDCLEWGDIDFSECLCWMNVASLTRSHLKSKNADSESHVGP